jgi:hypothetical protein
MGRKPRVDRTPEVPGTPASHFKGHYRSRQKNALQQQSQAWFHLVPE